MLNEPKKVRGKGIKPSMVYLSLRVDKEVYEFYNAYSNRSAKIREVLSNFIKQQGEVNEKQTDEYSQSN